MSCGTNTCSGGSSNDCYGAVCYTGCGNSCGGNCGSSTCGSRCGSNGCYSSCDNWCYYVCVDGASCGTSS